MLPLQSAVAGPLLRARSSGSEGGSLRVVDLWASLSSASVVARGSHLLLRCSRTAGGLLRFDSSAARALNRRGWLCSARRIVRERPAEAAQTARRRAARRESSLPEKYVERTPSTRSAGAQGQRQEAPRAGSPTPSTRREESGIARQA